MIHFFGDVENTVFAVESTGELSARTTEKLNWLFGNQPKLEQSAIADFFVGPRAAMVTPWSTNAVEITQNMHIEGIVRIEEYHHVNEDFSDYDPMLSQKFSRLDQDMFDM
ncbi:MAG: hypothetical protein HKO61_10290, partial [Flavobacteriaceae bacterium]|nr:hypothetical protein [Flavobacteriaceae bacterium]